MPSADRAHPARVADRAHLADLIDWEALQAAAVIAMRAAYCPYSQFPVGVAGLVDDGRVVTGCNVENAAYGVALCAECGMVSQLHLTGGGRLVAVYCVGADGQPLMACGRCRQLLWENGGPTCLVMTPEGVLPMSEILPQAFGREDLDHLAGSTPTPTPTATSTPTPTAKIETTASSDPDHRFDPDREDQA